MSKRCLNMLLLWSVTLSLALSGCGGGSGSSPSSSQTLTGVATAGTPITGTVTLKDSSEPAVTQTTQADADGKYSFDVSTLKAPFILAAEMRTSATATATQIYSYSDGDGRANINPFSNVAVGAAAQLSDADELFSKPTRSTMETIGRNKERIIEALKEQLAPLFQLYGVTHDPVDDDPESERSGLDALFSNVKITLYKGVIQVTNRKTGGIIFKALVTNIEGGTFYPQNLPGASGTTDGAALYGTYCGSCHGPLATSNQRGESAAEIQSAINEVASMRSLSILTASQIQAIAAALGSSTPAPSSCTYTYSAWSACKSDNTQTRTMLTSSPAGCTGTPVLSQSCTYVPPAPAACTYTYSTWGACKSDNTQSRTMLTSSPAGCTGTPILSQLCAYVEPACTYTYSAWGTCKSDNTQSRTMLTSSPAGCAGTPVLSQACTYVPPAPASCTYTYSAWGACKSDNTQTRTMLTSSPAGCAGTPVLSQDCTYVPPAPACGSCHAIPPSTGKHTFHKSFVNCATCHGTGYSTTTVNSTTHANGTINIATTPGWNPTTRSCSNSCHGSKNW